MPMSKKDFEAVAVSLLECKPDPNKLFEYSNWESIIERLAKEFKKVYPRFDEDKFKRVAKGYEEPFYLRKE